MFVIREIDKRTHACGMQVTSKKEKEKMMKKQQAEAIENMMQEVKVSALSETKP